MNNYLAGTVEPAPDWLRCSTPPKCWQEVGRLHAHGNPKDLSRGINGLSRFSVRAVAVLPDKATVLCAVPYRTELVLGKLHGNKPLTVIERLSTAEPCPQKGTHTLAFIMNWCAQLTDEFIRLAVPAGEKDAALAWHWYLTQYHRQLRLLVDWAREEAARTGYAVDPADWYEGAGPGWGEEEFTSPMCPSLTHAVVVSLTLALPPDRAAVLIRAAEFLDRGFVLFGNPAEPKDPRPAQATSVYEGARRLLRDASYEWAQHGQYTPWRALRARGVTPNTVLEALQMADQTRVLAASAKNKKRPDEDDTPRLIRLGPPAPYGEAPKGYGVVDNRDGGAARIEPIDPHTGGTF
jgi:hypothetical protein